MSRARDISKFASQIDSTGVIVNNTLETVIDQDYIVTYSTASASSGATVYNRFDSIPTSGLSAGDLAFIDSSNKHYVFSGEGWYLINYPENIAPSFTGLQDSYSFNFGDSAFDITLTGTDSNLLDRSLTFSVTGDNSLDSAASISQSDNVFTVTPDADSDNYTVESTVTFSLTDGKSITSSSTLFRAVTTYVEPSSNAVYLNTPDGTSGGSVTRTVSSISTSSSGIASQTVAGQSFEVDGSSDYLRYITSGVTTSFTSSSSYKFVWAINIPLQNDVGIGMSCKDGSGSSISLATYSNKVVAFQGTGTTSRVLSPTMATNQWYIMTVNSNFTVSQLFRAKTPGGTPYDINCSTGAGGYAPPYAENNNELIFSGPSGALDGYISRALMEQRIAGVALYPTTMTDDEMLADFDTQVFGN